MVELKPLTVYVHSGGPNPYKVTIVLEELRIPYNKVVVANPKDHWFLAINPNGRVPAITDPNNNNLTLWESGAILEYLVEIYDKDGELSLEDAGGKWALKQYLHFQMSGQGPYFGQAVWFHRCPEDVPLAKDRYIEQTIRVIEVLDNILEKKTYLVGNKCTYADLSFIPWNRVALQAPFFKDALWGKPGFVDKFPNFLAWHKLLNTRPAVKAAYDEL